MMVRNNYFKSIFALFVRLINAASIVFPPSCQLDAPVFENAGIRLQILQIAPLNIVESSPQWHYTNTPGGTISN